MTSSQLPGEPEIVAWRSIPVRLHWSVPVLALALGGSAWAPGVWAGYALVLAAHLLGHALVARGCGLRVTAVEIHGVGGACRVQRPGGAAGGIPLRVSLGGVLGQALLLGVAWLVQRRTGWEPGSAAAQGLEMAVGVNAAVLGLNLLPLRGLDGLEAWTRFQAWRRPQRMVIRPLTLRPASASLEDELAFLEALDRVDPAISPGVEAVLRRISLAAAQQRSGDWRADDSKKR